MRYFVLFFIFCSWGAGTLAQTTGFSTQNLGNILNASGYELSLLDTKEGTTGSRCFLGNWLKGRVTASDGTVVENDSVLYYYDKISHDLYYTYDKKLTMKVESRNVGSFTLQEGNKSHHFKRLDLIEPGVFFEALVEEASKCSLYKLTVTKFKKADYMNHGLYESGSRFDQYIDNFKYYVVLPGGEQYRQVSFKRKSLKEVFDDSGNRLSSYLSKHGKEPVNEDFLKGLVDHLNKDG